MSLNLTRGLEVRGKYSNIDYLYGPYTSKERACSKVNINVRKIGLTVGIIEQGSVVEYWWRDATDDESLILKNPSKEEVDTLNEKINNLEQLLDLTFTLEEKQKLAGIENGATNTNNEDVENWGFTKNIGTVTKVRINGLNKTPSKDGLIDLGTVDVVLAESKLPQDYQPSSLEGENLRLQSGESHSSAISKLEKAIIGINPSSTVNIQGHETPLNFHQEYYLKLSGNKDRIPTFEAIGNLLGKYHEYVTSYVPGTNTRITLDTIDLLHSPDDSDRIVSLRALSSFGKSVADRIEESELVTAAALNDLNYRINNLKIYDSDGIVVNKTIPEQIYYGGSNSALLSYTNILQLESSNKMNTTASVINSYYYIAIPTKYNINILTLNNENITDNFLLSWQFTDNNISYQTYVFHLNSGLPLDTDITITLLQ